MSDIMILEQGRSSHGFNMKVRQVALTKFESQTRLCLGLLIGTKLTKTL